MLNFTDVRNRVAELRRGDIEKLGKSIDYLMGLLNSTEDIDDRLDLMGELRGEYIRYGRKQDQSRLLWQSVEEFPTRPEVWIALAEHLVFDEQESETLEVASRAVAVAKESRQLVRHALQTKARAARKRGDYKLFEEVLREVLMDEYPAINADIGFEADVVADLPNGVVDQNVIRAFLSRVRC